MNVAVIVLSCDHCKQDFGLNAEIKLVSEGRSDPKFVHCACFKEWHAHHQGLMHKCPECDGRGTKNGKVTARSAQGYTVDTGDGIGRTEHAAVAWEQETCRFCHGFGYVEKKPVPVMVQTGWRHGD